MDNRIFAKVTLSLMVLTAVLVLAGEPAKALSGAIFTTDKNGHTVNQNIYRDKCDVYLDGGPGPGAPPSSAALPEGWYYFQVTDPSGKVLLSTDDVENRQFYVNESGVIAAAIDHPIRIDRDGTEYGARVIQLCPYDDTPNSGGVYKVWVTRQEDYDMDLGGRHGFIPAFSKTDNFKVAKKPPTQHLTITKFKDCNFNGQHDPGEAWLSGWYLWITPPDGPDYVGPEFQTPLTLDAWPGVWTVREIIVDDWLQTALIIDGVPRNPISDTAAVTFGTRDEDHSIVFGNIPLGCIRACKFYDRDGDGEKDCGEPPVAGIRFILVGTDITAADPHVPNVSRTGHTGSGGCVAFGALLPGVYTLTEVLPTNCQWQATTPTVVEDIIITCDSPTELVYSFGNACVGQARFHTKGYWHNKNGLAEITEADRDYINGLAPYSAASSYFGDGDEPFDGYYANGSPVAAAFNNDDGSLIWGAGTWQAEISQFLVDSNAGGNPREQLAQQLLAFILNVRHRLCGNVAIQLPHDSWTSAGSLIDAAIAAWSSGTAADQNALAGLLDQLNNNGAVVHVLCSPCPVVY
jgi:hypothetical protein